MGTVYKDNYNGFQRVLLWNSSGAGAIKEMSGPQVPQVQGTSFADSWEEGTYCLPDAGQTGAQAETSDLFKHMLLRGS